MSTYTVTEADKALLKLAGLPEDPAIISESTFKCKFKIRYRTDVEIVIKPTRVRISRNVSFFTSTLKSRHIQSISTITLDIMTAVFENKSTATNSVLKQIIDFFIFDGHNWAITPRSAWSGQNNHGIITITDVSFEIMEK